MEEELSPCPHCDNPEPIFFQQDLESLSDYDWYYCPFCNSEWRYNDDMGVVWFYRPTFGILSTIKWHPPSDRLIDPEAVREDKKPEGGWFS
jgi:hypothetical protein